MTTVILTTIGIIIATAATLAVIFYGGEAFYSGRVASEASRLTVEGAQVETAVSSFRIREGRNPGDGSNPQTAMNEVIGRNFLDQAPIGSNGPWVIDYDNGLIRSDVGSTNDTEALNICREARSQQGLPENPTPYMCDGSDHPNGRLPANEPCCRF